MPYEAPFESLGFEVEYGGKVVFHLDELPHLMEEAYETAVFLMADALVEELGQGRVPKRPWPILTGRSKGIPPFTGAQGGFYVDDVSGEGWDVWNRTSYGGFVERGIAGKHRRKDGGRFIEKHWLANEERFFDIARDFWDEQ